MGEPKGTGLETARQMAKFENYNEETGKVFEEDIPVTYSGVLEKILLEVKVAKDDMGKVIGRKGNVAKSIRTVMKAMATKEHKKVTVEFIG